MKRRLCILALLALTTGVMAQEEGLKIDVNFLTRGEVRAGGLSSSKSEDKGEEAEEGEEEIDKNLAAFILERTLFGAGYTKSDFSFQLTAQHSGTWGSSEGGIFNVYEAWVKMGSKNGFFAKIGRQNLSYDDQRIFGADDWAMTARSHDVIKLGYEGHGHKVHVIGGFNQNPSNMSGGTYYEGDLQPYKAIEALWYHYDIPRTNLGASLIFLNMAMQGSITAISMKTFQQQLAGAYLSFTPKKWNVEAAYYHQFGDDASGLPIDAWMTSAKVIFSPSVHWSFKAGYDYLSGDEDFATPAEGNLGMMRHETIHGFSSLNGSHHKFFGAMDFFYVTTYVNGFTPGLQNAYVGLSCDPEGRLSFDTSYHFLATATKLRNADKPLGHEFEVSASLDITKEATLSAGYTFMSGTETMVVLKRSSDKRELNWGWIMLSVTPKFLSNK